MTPQAPRDIVGPIGGLGVRERRGAASLPHPFPLCAGASREQAPQYSSDQQKAAVEDRARLGALSYGGGKPSSPKEKPLEAPPLDSMG